MANNIRIKRSSATNTPGSLLEGELAWSNNASPNSTDELFIGNPSATVLKILSLAPSTSVASPNDTGQDNQTITSGTGLSGAEGGSAGDVTLALDISELSVTSIAATDWIAFDDAGTSNKALVSGVDVNLMDTTNIAVGSLANIATASIVGRVTAATGAIEVLTGAQATTLIDVFTSTEKGLAPLSGGGTTNFMRADGTWATPAGGGNVTGEGTTVVANFAFWNAIDGTAIDDDGISLIDDDTMGTASAVTIPTSESVKAYVDGLISSPVNYLGSYNAATDSPALDTGSPSITIGDMYTVTAAGDFFTEALEVGDVLIAEETSADAAALTDWTLVQKNIDVIDGGSF